MKFFLGFSFGYSDVNWIWVSRDEFNRVFLGGGLGMGKNLAAVWRGMELIPSQVGFPTRNGDVWGLSTQKILGAIAFKGG